MACRVTLVFTLDPILSLGTPACFTPFGGGNQLQHRYAVIAANLVLLFRRFFIGLGDQ